MSFAEVMNPPPALGSKVFNEANPTPSDALLQTPSAILKVQATVKRWSWSNSVLQERDMSMLKPKIFVYLAANLRASQARWPWAKFL